MRPSRRLVTALATVALVTVMGLLWAPGHRTLVVSAAAMVGLAALLLEMGRTALALSSEGPGWARVLRKPAARERRPSDLEQLERVLGWGQYAPGDFNYEVRPLLRRLVAQRVLERHGVDLDARPDAARAIVSAELWDLVVSKQSSEEGRVIRTVDITRMVDEIEDI